MLLMKTNKFYSMVTTLMVVLSALMLTSCTEDQMIGMTLQGTWVGNMYTVNTWNGNTYKASESEITFTTDPFRSTKGTGYWIDYYSGYSWDYVANHIRWEVRNTDLYIYFMNDGGFVVLTDYRVSNNRFEGYIYDDNSNPLYFSLRKVYDSSNNSWDDYNYGWGYWSEEVYYFAKANEAKASIEGVSMIEDTEKPVRHIIMNTVK